MNAKNFLIALAFLFSSIAPGRSQGWEAYEHQLEKVARIVSPAVLPIAHIGLEDAGVRGSAFLINNEGYFLTAAHVLREYKPNTGYLTLVFPQKNGMGNGGAWFEIVDKDEKLDIALCKVRGLDKEHWTWSSLSLSPAPIVAGKLVVIAGFPLGSWNASIQPGSIAADKTVLDVPGMLPLFQVSVAGNQGDSGGPVVDLKTGRVMGIIVRGSLNASASNAGVSLWSSGIMYALPITKVTDILTRNHIQIIARNN